MGARLWFCVCAAGWAAAQTNSTQVAPPIPITGAMGKVHEIISDRTTQVSTLQGGAQVPSAMMAAAAQCTQWREVRLSYEYETSAGPLIYYTVYQCLNGAQSVTRQLVYFSYVATERGSLLPDGCPPPVVQGPSPPDSCSAGFTTGDVIARTSARLMLPWLLSTAADGPLVAAPELAAVLALALVVRAAPALALTASQQATLAAFVTAALAPAQPKLQCVLDIVPPSPQNVTVLQVCTRDKAGKALADELTLAVTDWLYCRYVDCRKTDAFKQLTSPNNTATTNTTNNTTNNTTTPPTTPQTQDPSTIPAITDFSIANYYFIVDKGSLLFFTYDWNSNILVLYSDSGGDSNQQWIFQPGSTYNSWWLFDSTNTALVYAYSTSNQPLLPGSTKKTTDQELYIYSNGDGTYRFVNLGATSTIGTSKNDLSLKPTLIGGPLDQIRHEFVFYAQGNMSSLILPPGQQPPAMFSSSVKLLNVATGNAFTAHEEAIVNAIYIRPCDNANQDQQFNFISMPDRTFAIQSTSRGTYITYNPGNQYKFELKAWSSIATQTFTLSIPSFGSSSYYLRTVQTPVGLFKYDSSEFPSFLNFDHSLQPGALNYFSIQPGC